MMAGSHQRAVAASHVIHNSYENAGEDVSSQRADEPVEMASSLQRGIFSRLASKLTRSSREAGGSNDTTPRTLRSSFTLRKSSESASFSKPNATLRPSNAKSASRSGSVKSVQGASYICAHTNTLSSFSDADTAHSSSSSRFYEKASPRVPVLTGLPRHDNPDDSPLLNMLEIGRDVFQNDSSHIQNSVSAADSISFLAGLPADSGSPRPTPRIANVQRGPPNPTAWGGGSAAGPAPLHDPQDTEPLGNESTTHPETPSLHSSATKSTMVMSCGNACKSSSGLTRGHSYSPGVSDDADLSRSHTPTFIPTDYDDLDADKGFKMPCVVPKTPQNQRLGLPQPTVQGNALSPQTPLIVTTLPGYGAEYPTADSHNWSADSAPSKPQASNVAVHNIIQSDGAAMQMQAMQSIASVGSPVPNPLGGTGGPIHNPNTLANSTYLSIRANPLAGSIHEESLPQLAEQQLNLGDDGSVNAARMDVVLNTPKQCPTAGAPDANITARMPFEASPFEMQPPSFFKSPAGAFNADPVAPAKGPEHSPNAPPPHTPPIATPPIRFCASCPHSQSQRAPSLRAALQENVHPPPLHSEYIRNYNCLAPTSEHAEPQCHTFAMHGAHAFGVHDALQWNLADGLAPAPPSVKQPSYALSSQPVSPDVSQPGSRRVSRPGSLHLPDTRSPTPAAGISGPPGIPQPPSTLPVSTLPCHAFNSCSGSTDTQEPAAQHSRTHIATHIANMGPVAAQGSAYNYAPPAVGLQGLGAEQLQQLMHLRRVISVAWVPGMVDTSMESPSELSEAFGEAASAHTGAGVGVVESKATNHESTTAPAGPASSSRREPSTPDKALHAHSIPSQKDYNTSKSQYDSSQAQEKHAQPPTAAGAAATANSIDTTLPPKLKRVPLHRQCTPHPSEAYLPNPSPTKPQPARPLQHHSSPPSKPPSANPPSKQAAAHTATPNHASNASSGISGNAPRMLSEASVSSITEPIGDVQAVPPVQNVYSVERSRICQKVLQHLSQCTVAEAAETVRCVENSFRLLLEVNRTMTMHDNTAACMHAMHDGNPTCLNGESPDALQDTFSPAKSQHACMRERGVATQGESTGAISSHMGAMHTSCVAACIKQAAESARGVAIHNESNLHKPVQMPNFRGESSGGGTTVADNSVACDSSPCAEPNERSAHTNTHTAAVAADSTSQYAHQDSVEANTHGTSIDMRISQAKFSPEIENDGLAAPLTASRAASSVVEALQELAEQLRSDSASTDVATGDYATCMDRSRHNSPVKATAAVSSEQTVRQRQGMYLSHSNALALGCTPSVGSTGSGSIMAAGGGFGGLQGGLSGKPKGLWRGSHNVTESFIMHSLHAYAQSDSPAGAGGPSSNVQEVVSEAPCESAACMGSMHADDIDEIDDASTQLSGRSGSWLCLPGPPPVAHGMNGMHMFLSRGGSMKTGSMHISASMNICGDVLGPPSAPMSPRGGACGAAGTSHMARNSSAASQHEVAV